MKEHPVEVRICDSLMVFYISPCLLTGRYYGVCSNLIINPLTGSLPEVNRFFLHYARMNMTVLVFM